MAGAGAMCLEKEAFVFQTDPYLGEAKYMSKTVSLTKSTSHSSLKTAC